MKQWILFGALCLGATAGWAEVVVSPIQVDRATDNGVVTVRVVNSGSSAAQVYDVDLQLKDGKTNQWHVVKSWNDAVTLQPGQRLIFEVTPAPDSPLAAALQRGDYRLQAQANYHLEGKDFEAAGR